MKCEYGCGKEGIYKLSSTKYCCCEKFQQCPAFINKCNKKKKGRNYIELYGKDEAERRKNNLSETMKKNNPMYYLKPWNKGKHGVYSNKTLMIMRKKNKENKTSIEQIKNKFLIFSQVEDMRYNPNKSTEKEIQVHCKNHKCENSKEKGGWFTPTKIQFYERIKQVERGNGGCYFYCSGGCKSECPLFNLYSDPYKKIDKQYTYNEYQTFRKYVLERDDYKCQYCEEKAEHVHHERPQKLEPFFALDPDVSWAVCKKCHYKYGHKDECNTGNLANKICKDIKNETI